jgi:predicted Zn-dependent protease
MNTGLLYKASLITAGVLIFFLSTNLFGASQDFRTRSHQQAFQVTTENDVRSEIEFGQNIAARILGTMPIYSNDQLTRYVNLVGKALAANAGRPEIDFHFAVLDIEKINAYSAPGGYIFVTRGAVRQMQDESEMAAVIAHEIAHITEKHIVNEFKIKAEDDSTVSGVTRFVGGSGDSARVAFAQAVDKAMNVLLETGFKQQDEFGADNVATLLLTQTGYDPGALLRYLKRIKKVTEVNANKKTTTHPATEERLKKLQDLLETEGLTEIGLPRGQKRFEQNVTSR